MLFLFFWISIVVVFVVDGDGVECKGWNGDSFEIGWNGDDIDILGDVVSVVGRVKGDVFWIGEVFRGDGRI